MEEGGRAAQQPEKMALNERRQIVPSSEAGIGEDGVMPFGPLGELGPDPLDEPESDAEAEGLGPEDNGLFWQEQIGTALKNERRWRNEALRSEFLYFGPDQDIGDTDSESSSNTNAISDLTALIHSNIEVLKPLLFSETPQPIVQRRNRGDGRKDPAALMAAEAGQRIANYVVTTTDFDSAMVRVRDDWLIAGRGAARAMYRAKFTTKPVIDGATGQPAIGPDGQPLTQEVKADETVMALGWEWRRLLMAATHSWKKMPWIAFETPMTRSAIEKRFGKEKAARFRYSNAGLKGKERAFGDEDRERTAANANALDRTGEPMISPFDTANVWEIWNRDSSNVIWWSRDYDGGVVDKIPDPLGLEEFFPMPKPLLATTRGESMNPRPDIRYYEERAREIDLASNKMSSLLNIISVSGLIPASSAESLKDLFSGKHQIIPVQSWMSVIEKGGVNNLIQWLPLEQIIKALQALQQLREMAKQAMFEASGVSDIMRAQGDPRETAAAQNLKGRYAGMRLSNKQREMAIYARDMLRILVEMAVELFDSERLADICGLDLPLTEIERQGMIMEQQTIMAQFQQAAAQHQMAMQQYEAGVQALQQQGVDPAQAGAPPPPEAPQPPELEEIPEVSWETVHARLKTDLARKLTITIETQSTILADEAQDKEMRVEFLSAFSTFVQQLAPLMMTGQFDMKMVKELLLFGVRGFPKSRTLESMISQMPDEPPQTQQEAEDTAITVAKIKAEADLQIEQMKLEDAEKERQHEMAMKSMDIVKEAAMKAAEPGPPSPDVPEALQEKDDD
jgi:hypothetical protein